MLIFLMRKQKLFMQMVIKQIVCICSQHLVVTNYTHLKRLIFDQKLLFCFKDNTLLYLYSYCINISKLHAACIVQSIKEVERLLPLESEFPAFEIWRAVEKSPNYKIYRCFCKKYGVPPKWFVDALSSD